MRNISVEYTGVSGIHDERLFQLYADALDHVKPKTDYQVLRPELNLEMTTHLLCVFRDTKRYAGRYRQNIEAEKFFVILLHL
jgi:hypothetical protein